MHKIQLPGDLKKFRQAIESQKSQSSSTAQKVQVKVAMATCGIASGAKEVMDFMEGALRKRSIDAEVTPTGCMCYCYAEPTVEVTLPGHEPVVFGYVDVKKADIIIENFIRKGEPVEGIIPANYRSIDE